MRIFPWRRASAPPPGEADDVGGLPEVRQLRERRQRMKAATFWARKVLDALDRDGEDLAEVLILARGARRPTDRRATPPEARR